MQEESTNTHALPATDGAEQPAPLLTPSLRITFPESTYAVHSYWFEEDEPDTLYASVEVAGVDLGAYVGERFSKWDKPIASILIVAAVIILIRRVRSASRTGCCGACGYEINVPRAETCPECGATLQQRDVAKTRRSRGLALPCIMIAFGLALLAAGAMLPRRTLTSTLSTLHLHTYHPAAVSALLPDFRNDFDSSFGTRPEFVARTETIRFNLADGTRERVAVYGTGHIGGLFENFAISAEWDDDKIERLTLVNLLNGSRVASWYVPAHEELGYGLKELVQITESTFVVMDESARPWLLRTEGGPIRMLGQLNEFGEPKEYLQVGALPGPRPLIFACRADTGEIEWFSLEGAHLLTYTFPEPSYETVVPAPDGSAFGFEHVVDDVVQIHWYAAPASLARSEDGSVRREPPRAIEPPAITKTMFLPNYERGAPSDGIIRRGEVRVGWLVDEDGRGLEFDSPATISTDQRHAIASMSEDWSYTPVILVWTLPPP